MLQTKGERNELIRNYENTTCTPRKYCIYRNSVLLVGVWGELIWRYINCDLKAPNKYQMMVAMTNVLNSNLYISKIVSMYYTVPSENQ